MNAPMPVPQRTLVQRALGGHAAIGLLAGALLYIIALSGALVVIHDRWQRWEQPGIAETETLSPAAAQAAMAAVIASEKGKPATTHLYLRMPTPDLPRAVVTTDHGAWYVDGTGNVVGREAHSWTEFVIGMHEYLHLPVILGMIVVGALGVALAALAFTGILAHPRILRDAFRLRTRHDSQIARADWHNRLGVWTLPFVLATTLTGAFIGLGSLGTTMLANAYTGGDLVKVYAPIFGEEPAANPAPAPLPDIATALATVTQRFPDSTVTYIIAHDPGTAGSHVQVVAEQPRRLIYGETYRFGPRGEWHGPVGLSDGALGQQFAASTYNLHFGNFAGLPVELAYMVFGLGLCVVTATGTTLWLQKRRRRGLGGTRLAACWAVVIWGVPLLIVALAWARAIGGPDLPFAGLFWGVLALAVLVAAVMPRWVAALPLRTITLGAAMLTGLLHLLVLRPPALETVVIDAALILLPGLALYALRRRPGPVAAAA
jgi:uncharacterized iron-regulated membrane protein